MNFLRLGVFTGAKQIQDERQARADKAAAEQRQRMLDDLVMDRQMRGSGYVPDAEAGPDGSLSGRSLDEIVGAATGIPTVGMKDTGTRYGQSVGGYKYDRMSLPVRKQQAEIARAERDANEPYRMPATPNIDPLSDVGIDRAAKRAGAVARAEAPYKKDPKAPTPKQPNESNTKAAGMLHRVIPAGQAINKFDDRKALDALAAKAGMLGNWASTPEGRQLTVAAQAWIYSVLRPESGATLGDKELENYNRTYIPQPGDDDATLAMKRQNRRLAEEGVAIQAGPAFTGGPRSAMEADSLANPTEFNARYHKGAATVDPNGILAKYGIK